MTLRAPGYRVGPPSDIGLLVFRWLLRAYPAAFRRRYESDLIAFFDADRRHSRYAARWHGPLRFWFKTIKDLAMAATRERMAAAARVLRGRPPEPTQPTVLATRPRRSTQRQPMQTIFQDLRFAARGLRKTAGSSVLSVFVFGMGIGLCTVMFSIIYGVFFRGLDVPESDELLLLRRNNVSRGVQQMGVTQHDFYDWREQQTSFEGLSILDGTTVNLSDGADPERYRGAFVSANMFDLLEVRPVIGRTFLAEDDAAGAPLTVLLGYDVWERRYALDSAVIGRSIRLNGEAAAVIGVMPDGFRFPANESLWLPRRDERAQLTARGNGSTFTVMGRLKDGIGRDQAELEFAAIANRLGEEYPETNQGVSVVMNTFIEADSGPELIAVLSAMMVATVLVLLIACANVANLLLARAALRAKEAAVRAALGASRIRVALPFFSEALLLSLGGAVFATGIAYIGVRWFNGAVATSGKPYYMDITVDLPILGFVAVVAIVTSIVAGAAPAFKIANADVNGILKDESRGTSGLHGGRLSRALVVGEVALSCALLIAAGLMTKSIVKLNNHEYSFEVDHVFTARLGLPRSEYPDRASRMRFFSDLEEQLRAIPPARQVALATSPPTLNDGFSSFGIEGRTYERDQDYPSAATSTITPDFFYTFGRTLSRGRGFEVQDDTASLDVAIVNQSFVDRFFPDENPLGRKFRLGRSNSQRPWMTIVGVAPNMRMNEFQPGQDSAGFYVPLRQSTARFVTITVQTAGGDPIAITQDVRRVVRALDPDLPIYDVYSMKEMMASNSWFYGAFGSLFIAFGAAALFMASVGLYGVLSFSVNRRIHEMGIRMALGAGAKQVVRLVMRQGLGQLGIGLGVGLVMAFGLTNVIGILMFEVEPRDPMVFGAVVAVIAMVGLVASFVPARRATSVDPMVALRQE